MDLDLDPHKGELMYKVQSYQNCLTWRCDSSERVDTFLFRLQSSSCKKSLVEMC